MQDPITAESSKFYYDHSNFVVLIYCFVITAGDNFQVNNFFAFILN